jgi:pyruvate,orthophosphate dikinase
MPQAFSELLSAGQVLEQHFRDMCDIEFTIERGRLWLLQVRPGKRSAPAAVRIALDLVDDSAVRLSRSDVAARITPEVVAALYSAKRTAIGNHRPITRGLGASPGVATGRVCFSADEAIAVAERGDPVLFVAVATSPSDIHAFAVASGVLTATGGLVSHAALVAREWHLPAVVGATEIEIGFDELRVRDSLVRQGELLTIDGTSGEVFRGRTSVEALDGGSLIERWETWCRGNDHPASE